MRSPVRGSQERGTGAKKNAAAALEQREARAQKRLEQLMARTENWDGMSAAKQEKLTADMDRVNAEFEAIDAQRVKLGIKNAATEGGKQYQAREIDKWDGKDHGGAFRIGKLSKPLRDIGVPENDIWFDQSKACKQLLGKDEITKEELKKIPQILNNPIAITQSYDKTILVFGQIYDSQNNPIVIAVRISATNRRNHITTVNKIRSIGTRNHDLSKLLADENILYLSKNKKETNKWFNALGRSTPFGGTRYGLIRMIPLDWTESKSQFSERESYAYRGASEGAMSCQYTQDVRKFQAHKWQIS